jgi:iron complex transport system ATP-binding protein
MIRVNNLSCGYTGDILSHVTFAAEQNLCILGPNGSGKSTLAKALCGLLPYRGSVTLGGAELREMEASERAKAITYIPPRLESYDTYISVEEFVLMGRYPHKPLYRDYTHEDYERVKALLKQSELDASQAIGSLSSGQQQLLLISQALAQSSSIVIFDEPTANLDPAHAKRFYEALQNLPEQTRSIVITHDLNFAAHLKGAVLFVDGGTATFYAERETFFSAENLRRCYGVDFDCDGTHIGVRYG